MILLKRYCRLLRSRGMRVKTIFLTEPSWNKTIRAEPRLNKVSINSLYNRMLGLEHIENLTVQKMIEYY